MADKKSGHDSVGDELGSLIDGIRDEGGDEAEKILRDAEKEAKRKREYAANKAQALEREAQDKAALQADKARHDILSSLDMYLRRGEMELQDKVYRGVLDRVRVKLRDLVDTPGYSRIIENLIVEGAIGLGAERASVVVSKEERPHVNDDLLRRAEKRVLDLAGIEVSLDLSSEISRKQGVVLKTGDSRMNFNNLMESRLSRKIDDIRSLIWEKLLNRTEGKPTS
jgi:vacuolar-type H+-ATPase subunit E/Vma4